MKTAALITAILQTLGLKIPHTETCEHYTKAAEVAPLILAAVESEYARAVEQRRNQRWRSVPTRMPAKLVAAVIRSESTYRMGARGKAGELGYMQIKPDGLATRVCPDLLDKLDDPASNIECGVRLMSFARRLCGGEPEHWLGIFNGSKCGPSKYADKVLSFARMAGWPPPGVLVGALP